MLKGFNIFFFKTLFLFNLKLSFFSPGLLLLLVTFVPWTTRYPLYTLDHQVPFAYIGPFGTFAYIGPFGTYSIPWTTKYLLPILDHKVFPCNHCTTLYFLPEEIWEQQQYKGAKEESGTLWLVGMLWLAGMFGVAGVSLYICCLGRPQLEDTHTGENIFYY